MPTPNQRIADLEQQAIVLQTQADTLNTKLDAAVIAVSAQQQRIADLEKKAGDLQTQITLTESRLTDLIDTLFVNPPAPITKGYKDKKRRLRKAK